MDYHAHNICQDDIIRNPAYGSTFRDMEEKSPRFKEEPHNIRIYLETNCVKSFAEMRYVYSVWFTFVINNNIPPWLSIKREHIMLAMIILCMCLQQFFLI